MPNAVRAVKGKAKDSEAQYRLYVVRQADLEDIPTTVNVTAPAGWRITAATARLIASGKSLPVESKGGTARLAAPLSGDLTLDVKVERQ